MKRKTTIIEGDLEDVQTSNIYYETQVDKFNFRYRGGNVIEVSYLTDRNKTPIYEIVVSEGIGEKKFHTECSFWYMEEGINF